MSTVLNNSPALKLAGVAVIVIGSVMLFSMGSDESVGSSSSSNEAKAGVQSKSVDPEKLQAEKDTASQDRIRLSAQLQALMDEVRTLKGQIAAKQSSTSNVAIDESEVEAIAKRVLTERDTRDAVSSSSTGMNVGNDIDSELEGYVLGDDVVEEKPNIDFGEVSNNENTVGLSGYSVGAESVGQESVEWVLPADSEDSNGLFDEFLSKKDELNFTESSEEKKENNFVQYATLDKEAILYDAVLLTDLVGVTAYSGAVTSPYYFKLELGRDNIMTSGINLPHVAQMRMSGYAVGEWSKSCVAGTITSATFVFDDGTIHSVGSTGGAQGQGIGYISDPYGSPCITGEKYSDLMEYASVNGGLSALAAIGEGLSSAQFDTLDSASGLQQAFTGSQGELAVGEGLSGASTAFSNVIAKRYENTRDLVIANSGQYVVVQLTQQLAIDYDPNGRKILNENFESDLEEFYEKQALANN